MERIFHLKENGTSVKTEILAGLTTFMTMAYIIALNPLIIGTAPDKNFNLISGAPMFLDEAHTQVDPVAIGVSIGMVAAATALIAGIMTILMGVIVLLACLTTSVGLITACGEYFKKLAAQA